jgi:hypothetical protein
VEAPLAQRASGLIHIHEDDWGMRSLHPAAAWGEVRAALERAGKGGRGLLDHHTSLS